VQPAGLEAPNEALQEAPEVREALRKPGRPAAQPELNTRLALPAQTFLLRPSRVTSFASASWEAARD